MRQRGMFLLVLGLLLVPVLTQGQTTDELLDLCWTTGFADTISAQVMMSIDDDGVARFSFLRAELIGPGAYQLVGQGSSYPSYPILGSYRIGLFLQNESLFWWNGSPHCTLHATLSQSFQGVWTGPFNIKCREVTPPTPHFLVNGTLTPADCLPGGEVAQVRAADGTPLPLAGQPK